MNSVIALHRREIESGQRFEFGENWRRFLSTLNEDRIGNAERSLQAMLSVSTLAGKTFLDVGCGSGLFSLAAMRLGAARVHSFDFDPASVACTREVKARYCPGDECWTIDAGSALDADYLNALGQFDVVYSWGVLHHTGDMWRALAEVDHVVAPDGSLFLAIYNDQGFMSRVWTRIKRRYNRLPQPLKVPYAAIVMGAFELRTLLLVAARRQFGAWARSWTEQGERGMSRWHDVIDWVGGYPFEVATPQQIFEFYRERGYRLDRLTTTAGNGHGCNQFVLRKQQ